MHNNITSRALPNFVGAKVPVESGLIIHKWKKYLKNYHDKSLCEFLQYGWPLGYISNQPPQTVDNNHPSAVAHMSHVEDFIRTELELAALLGPFNLPRF